MAAVKRNKAPLSGEKEAGRPPALTDEQWAIVFSRILRQTRSVALEDVQRWIKANLGMDVSIATGHKDEMGLSFQLTGSRGTNRALHGTSIFLASLSACLTFFGQVSLSLTT